MSELKLSNENQSSTSVYLTGIGIGALFGLIAAYLYARASGEGERQQLRTGEIISLALAGLGLMRQITEAGKKK